MTFLAIALVMTTVAAAFVVVPLLRTWSSFDRRLTGLQRQVQDLNGAKSAGSVSSQDYEQRRSELADQIVMTLSPAPKRGLAVLGMTVGVGALLCLLALELAVRKTTVEGPHEAMPHEAMAQATAPPIDHGVDMNAAIERLAEKLRQHPDDAQGWALLGRTYRATGQYERAKDALHHAVEAEPGNSALAHEYEIADTPLPPMEDDSPQPQQSPIPTAASMGNGKPSAISVNVSVGASLKTQYQSNDVLFVIAKAVNGPVFPVAVARMSADKLPIQVTLTDQMAMLPNAKLSDFDEVDVQARISKSGNAKGQPGDLLSGVTRVSRDSSDSINLNIDHQMK